MPQDLTVQDLIRQEATKQGIPPALALAVAEQESSFNPTAIGKKLDSGEQAVGTFQILPSTAQHVLGGIDPHDPVQNIQGGVKYLRQLMDQHQGDLSKVLAHYGGVVTDQTYVPSVLAKVQRYQAAEPPAAAAQPGPPPRSQAVTSTSAGAGAPPPYRDPRAMFGDMVIQALDPRTKTGQQNIAGGLGAAGLRWGLGALATAALPEAALPTLAVRGLMAAAPVLGAYLGGGAAQAGQDLAAGQTPSLTAAHDAGTGQAEQEAFGQIVGWPVKGVLKRFGGAKSAAKGISATLDEALTAADKRVRLPAPPVTPSKAGAMVEGAAYGPAKSVKDTLGEDVGTAAASGPAIPTAPLRAKLDALAAQIQPATGHPQAAAQTISGVRMGPEQITALATAHPELGLTTLPADHPLPKVLDATREALRSTEALPFEDAHKIKRLLDEAVNWDSPAKKQAQQITKGFRQDLRTAMSGHEPYNQATEQYGHVARLYTKDVQKLHQEVLTNPEGIVAKLDWQKPTSAKLLKELTVDVPKQAGEAAGQQGEAAWNALRATWTHENLIAGGPKRLNRTIAQMEASGNGQEFLHTMYGDEQGQHVLQNLKQLGAAWQDATERAAAFKETALANTPSPAQAAADVGTLALHGHPIFAMRAAGRQFLSGPSAKELIQWASYSAGRTQFLIKHVLTGPDPGMAAADFWRWKQESEAAGTEPDRLATSRPQTAQAGPPPAPRVTPSHP